MKKPPHSRRPKNAYDTPTAEKRAIGRRLREAREINGMTLTEAAQALGYTQPVHLSYWETGQRMAPLDRLIQLARLYGTTMDFLCGLQDDPDRDPAAATTRAVAGMVASSVNRIIRSLTQQNVEIVRGMLPGSADAQRMAGLAIEASRALSRMRELSPGFDSRLKGGAQFVAKFEALQQSAVAYSAAVAKANRIMQVRTMREAANVAHCPEGPTDQIPLLPALDLMAVQAAAETYGRRDAVPAGQPKDREPA